MTEAARPNETPSLEELQQMIAEYEHSVGQEAALTPSSASLPDDALLWMAFVPNLPAPVAEASAFPRQPGRSAIETLEAMVGDGQVVAHQPLPRLTIGGPVTVYSMSSTRSAAVLTAYRNAPDPTIISERETRLRELLTQIGRSIASVSEDLLGRATPLWRWAALAGHADNAVNMVAAFDSYVDKANQAENAGELKHWIEAARPLAGLMTHYVETGLNDALARASRRLELLHRRDYDRRHLQSFMRREEQIEAFNQLLIGDSQTWALHFVGIGGVGKTMLLRYITNELASNYATARIDFDYLSPDYPQRNPGLLLWAFAQDLRMHVISAESEQAIRFFAQADQLLESLRQQREDLRHSGRPDRATDEPLFREALALYIDALRALNRRVILILDTCEELAKVSPAGMVPENVEETFRILRALHDGPQTLDDANAPPSPTTGLSDLRVIFSGRRLLARKGSGWHQEPLSKLEERPYLQLHEIRGFTKVEAEHYLRTIVKSPQGLVFRAAGQSINELDRDEITVVPEQFIAPIIRLSSPDAGAVAGLVWEGRLAVKRDQLRCNPYELAFYADWTTERPPPALEDLSVTNIGHYIKTRILGRLEDSTLAEILPAIVLLGHVDEQTLRAIAGLDKEEDAQAGKALFERLRYQEWMSQRPAVTPPGAAVFAILSIQPGMRKRLHAFFHQHRPQLSEARARATDYLERETLTRDLEKLDWSTFDAALRLLERDRDPDRVVRWWSQIEARILAKRDFKWALDLLGPILGEDGAAGLYQDHSGLEESRHSRMRVVVLSTYAAALLHQGAGQELAEVWEEIRRESLAHADAARQTGLQLRAQAGLINALAIDGSTIPQAEISGFWGMVEALQPTQLTLDQIAPLIAATEALVEAAELGFSNAGGEDENLLGPLALGPTRLAWLIGLMKSEAMSRDVTWPAQADGILAVARLLAARAHCLRGEYDSARRLFQQALATSPDALLAAQNKIWNDWIPPEDLVARLRLEYLRVLVPARLSPKQALAEIGSWSADATTVDSDRLHASLIRLQLDQGLLPLRALVTLGWADPKRLQLTLRTEHLVPGPARCNAHHEIVPLFVAAAELAYNAGQVELVRELMNLISSQPPRFDLEQVLHQAERVRVLLTRRMRLRDEGEQPGLRLAASLDLADRSLLWALDGLDGSKIRNPIPSVPSGVALPMRPRWLHAIWRTRYTLAAGAALPALRWARQQIAPALADSASDQVPDIEQTVLRLDVLEARLIALQIGESIALPEVTGLDFTAEDWRREHIARPIEALAVLLRRSSLTHLEALVQGEDATTASRPVVSLDFIAQVGLHRAAEIAFDEGEMLALRLPLAAAPLLNQACDWFTECGDYFGAVLAGTALALLQLQIRGGNPYHSMQRVGTSYEQMRAALLPERAKTQNLPTWETLLQIAAAPTLTNLNALRPLSWRPWLVRIVIALIGPDYFSAPATTVRRWLADTYTTLRRIDVDSALIDLARALPADLEGWLQAEDLHKPVANSVSPAPITNAAKTTYMNREQLRRGIEQRFSLGELHTLCFDLEINYEVLAGETKTEKVISFIQMMEQQLRLSELIAELNRLRPHMDWPRALAELPKLPELPKNLQALPVATIRQVLIDSFNEAELRALCFDLGIDYNNLDGQTKPDRVSSLCNLLANQRRTDQLVAYVLRERPEVEWTSAPAVTRPKPTISSRVFQELFHILIQYFSEREFRTLVFDLAIDYENLPGQSMTEKAQQLIQYVARLERLNLLIEMVHRERPNIPLSAEITQVRIDQPTSASSSSTRALRQKLTDYFSNDDLAALAFDLGIDYDDLAGEGKASKARELVAYMRRMHRIDELSMYMRRLRPDAFNELSSNLQSSTESSSTPIAPPIPVPGLILSISDLQTGSTASFPTRPRPVALSLTAQGSRLELFEGQATMPGLEVYEKEFLFLPAQLRQAIVSAYQSRIGPALKIQIEAPADLHGPCWEAMLYLAAGTNVDNLSLHMWRRVKHSKFPRPSQFSEFLTLYGWGGDFVGDKLIEQIWKSSLRTRFLHRTDINSAIVSTNTPVDILHLVGAVEEMTTGLRFRPGANPSMRTQGSTEQGDSQLLRAEDFGRAFPDLSVCILQGPLLNSGLRRLNSNRRDAALARAFAAEIAAQGVPAVIVIPTLTNQLALTVMELVAKDIESYETSLSESFNQHSVPLLLETMQQVVNRAQQTILHYGSQLAAPQEVMLDVCLYSTLNQI